MTSLAARTLALALVMPGCDADDSDDSAAMDTDQGTGDPAAPDDASTGSEDGSSDGSETTEDGDDTGGGTDTDGTEPPVEHAYTGNYELQTVNISSTDAFVADISLAVGPDDGDAHVVFTERPAGGDWVLRYAYRAYGADSFETETFTDRVHEPVEIFVDADGLPCLIFVSFDDPLSAASDLVLRCRDGSGSWQDETLDSFGGMLRHIDWLGHTLDHQGEPVVLYMHPNTGVPLIARRAGGAWSYGALESSDFSLGDAAAIAIDSNDEPRVAVGASTLVEPFEGGILYFATDGSAAAFGDVVGGGQAYTILDLALRADDTPIIARGNGSLYELDMKDETLLNGYELPGGATWLRVIYDPVDDLTFRVYGNGNLGFDVREGFGIPTAFLDPMTDGGGQFADPVYVHGQLHAAHWKGGGVPPQLRYTLATPIE